MQRHKKNKQYEEFFGFQLPSVQHKLSKRTNKVDIQFRERSRLTKL